MIDNSSMGASIFGQHPFPDKDLNPQRAKDMMDAASRSPIPMGAQHSVLSEARPNPKRLLRERANSLRHGAIQLETVAGMLPEVLTPEQEAALNFVLSGAQFAL